MKGGSQERTRREWADAAPAVERWNEKMMYQGQAASKALIEVSHVRPGMNILDLASGSGEPALSLAKITGREGHVTATDATPELLVLAEKSASEQGLINISFKHAEMEKLPFPNESFDLVTCRFGIMYTTDLERSLAEILRVLKPRGRVSFEVWGPLEENPYFSIPLTTLTRYIVFPAAETDAPNPFLYARKGSLSERIRGAGFHDVNEESRIVSWPWPGPVEEVWMSFQDLGKPFRKMIENLSYREAVGVEREITKSISRYYDGKDVNFPATVILVSAIKQA